MTAIHHSPTRRALLLAATALPFSACASMKPDSVNTRLEQLEREFGGRIGVFALDTGSGAVLRHRAGERFPLLSTFKLVAAAAVLARNAQVQGLMERRLTYAQADLVAYSPVTGKHVADGMTVAELCAAAIQYSDNTAANLLLGTLGDPAALTAYARSIGDTAFRLDRWETELNTAIPGDPRDTTTPEAMGRTLQQLVLGDALSPGHRDILRGWLLGNTTGAARIKAGIPPDWAIGDKTGTGDYGSANDVAVLWPPRRAPIVVAIYTTQDRKEAKGRSDVVASAARIAVGHAS